MTPTTLSELIVAELLAIKVKFKHSERMIHAVNVFSNPTLTETGVR